MRVALLVYGLFLLVVELVGNRLALVGWGRFTALDVASAVADASLAVALVLAVLLTGKLAVRRGRRWLRPRRRSLLADPQPPGPPIGVRSWRDAPAAPPAPDETAAARTHARPSFLSGYRYVTGP